MTSECVFHSGYMRNQSPGTLSCASRKNALNPAIGHQRDLDFPDCVVCIGSWKNAFVTVPFLINSRKPKKPWPANFTLLSWSHSSLCILHCKIPVTARDRVTANKANQKRKPNVMESANTVWAEAVMRSEGDGKGIGLTPVPAALKVVGKAIDATTFLFTNPEEEAIALSLMTPVPETPSAWNQLITCFVADYAC
nr:PREDICTED: uncharacterized protein LOC107078137 isoform X2 [Lepisosteus oculatus]